MNLKQAGNDILRSAKQHSPELLTGFGIAGMVTSTVLAVRATPKALKLIEMEERRLKRKLTPWEIVKTTWTCYISAGVTTIISGCCIIKSDSEQAQRYAMLATVHSATEDAFRVYQDKVVETIGENKERQIREEIDREDMKRHPYTNSRVHVRKKGEVLCYEVRTKSYFMSDAETIRQCKNEFKGRLINELYCSYTDWLYDLGCPPDDTRDTDYIGWSSDDMKDFDILIGCAMADDDTPCLTISFAPGSMPHEDYDNLHRTRN